MAIPRNRVTATLRALIHVVPMSIALLEITWNWAGYYYGKQFERQAYYQIVAKTHEVLIQASLAVIVLSYILFESTFGEGIPFGAFLGSLQFLQIGYLWSPELWSSFTTFQLKRKICVLVLLIVSSLLAASAGPSSATLLIPRLIHWPLDPSHLAINGTFQDVWPDHMNSRNVPESCSVIPITDANSICPAGPWATLSQDFNVFASQYNATHQLRAVQVIQVSVPFILSNKLSTASPCLTSNELQQCGSTVQDVVLEGAQSAVSQWEQDVGFNKAFQDIKHYVSKDYYQPYTLASCLSDTITDTNMEEPIQFPHISETESELKQDRTTASLPNITKAQAFRAAGDESEFRLKWFDLAQTLSWDDVIGAVVLHPPTPGSDTINITTCTFGAGWGSSIATLYSSQDSSFFSNMYGTPKSWPTQEEEVFAEIVTISIPNYANLSGFAYPQRRITLITDWARFLNPIIPVTKDYNSSTIHLLLTSSPGNTDSIGIPKVLAGYLASGLARNGMNLEWQGTTLTQIFCDLTSLTSTSTAKQVSALRRLPRLPGRSRCLRLRLRQARHDDKAWDRRHDSLLRPGIPAHSLRHQFRHQQHCLGFDSRIAGTGNEFFTHATLTKYVRRNYRHQDVSDHGSRSSLAGRGR